MCTLLKFAPLMLCACEGAPSANATEDPEEPLPSAWHYDGATTEAALDANALETAIEMALETTRRLNPDVLWAAYEQAMAARDTENGCPGLSNPDSAYGSWGYHASHCATADGVVFDGLAAYGQLEGDGREFTNVDCAITYPDGLLFEGVGRAFAQSHTLEDGSVQGWWASLHGRFHWNDASGELTWLAKEALWLDLSIYGYRFPEIGGWLYYVSGGISLGEGFDGWDGTLTFDQLMMYRDDEQEAIEPVGRVWVRDTRGDEYNVSFDGPGAATAWSFPLEAPPAMDTCDDCDGCGGVTWGGEVLDMQVCPDFSNLTGWEEPW